MKPTWILALGSLIATAALATSVGPSAVARGPVDTTPPLPVLKTHTHQDLKTVLDRGIDARCRTEDDEAPVDCRLAALRKGRNLGVDHGHVVPPYVASRKMRIKIHGSDRRRLRRADPPIRVKLRLTVTDPAGNVATDVQTIEICKKHCVTHGGP